MPANPERTKIVFDELTAIVEVTPPLAVLVFRNLQVSNNHRFNQASEGPTGTAAPCGPVRGAPGRAYRASYSIPAQAGRGACPANRPADHCSRARPDVPAADHRAKRSNAAVVFEHGLCSDSEW